LDIGGTCDARDQRGVPRTGPCDAGAYERVLCHGSVVDIVGTPHDDELSGGKLPDTFLGLGGDDEFQGSLDDDVACGGDGDDHLIGGPGDDRLFGDHGADRLEGEQGIDRCVGSQGHDRLVTCER
jgi:Ca2+-binding RTX toxin-like protein